MLTAIQTLIDLCIIANRDQAGKPLKLSETLDDDDGSGTLKALKKAKALVEKVTGNSAGSLGLHPAIYFYGPSGRHSSYMFMGTMQLIAKHVVNNNSGFFKKLDRKSVVSGKSVSVRVDLGGRRIIKKKNKKATTAQKKKKIQVR